MRIHLNDKSRSHTVSPMGSLGTPKVTSKKISQPIQKPTNQEKQSSSPFLTQLHQQTPHPSNQLHAIPQQATFAEQDKEERQLVVRENRSLAFKRPVFKIVPFGIQYIDKLLERQYAPQCDREVQVDIKNQKEIQYPNPKILQKRHTTVVTKQERDLLVKSQKNISESSFDQSSKNVSVLNIRSSAGEGVIFKSRPSTASKQQQIIKPSRKAIKKRNSICSSLQTSLNKSTDFIAKKQSLSTNTKKTVLHSYKRSNNSSTRHGISLQQNTGDSQASVYPPTNRVTFIMNQKLSKSNNSSKSHLQMPKNNSIANYSFLPNNKQRQVVVVPPATQSKARSQYFNSKRLSMQTSSNNTFRNLLSQDQDDVQLINKFNHQPFNKDIPNDIIFGQVKAVNEQQQNTYTKKSKQIKNALFKKQNYQRKERLNKLKKNNNQDQQLVEGVLRQQNFNTTSTPTRPVHNSSNLVRQNASSSSRSPNNFQNIHISNFIMNIHHPTSTFYQSEQKIRPHKNENQARTQYGQFIGNRGGTVFKGLSHSQTNSKRNLMSKNNTFRHNNSTTESQAKKRQSNNLSKLKERKVVPIPSNSKFKRSDNSKKEILLQDNNSISNNYQSHQRISYYGESGAQNDFSGLNSQNQSYNQNFSTFTNKFIAPEANFIGSNLGVQSQKNKLSKSNYKWLVNQSSSAINDLSHILNFSLEKKDLQEANTYAENNSFVGDRKVASSKLKERRLKFNYQINRSMRQKSRGSQDDFTGSNNKFS